MVTWRHLEQHKGQSAVALVPHSLGAEGNRRTRLFMVLEG